MKHRHTATVIAFLVLSVLACGSNDDASPGGGGAGSPAAAGAGGESDGARAGADQGGSHAGAPSGGEPAAAGAGGGSLGGQGGEAGGGGSSDCPIGDDIPHPKVCADSFTITMACSSGPCDGQLFVHTYDVTWRGFAFSGSGESMAMGNTYTEAICGAVSGDKLSFHSVYTKVDAGFTIDGTATLAANGTAEGLADAVDPGGDTQEFSIAVTTLKVGCK